jgi:molecular chaperone DnaJ
VRALQTLDLVGKAPYFLHVARDYYRTLGVTKGATDSEVKRAYRRLARKLHPDVTGDDPKSTERFKEITEAYEVLSDPKRRRNYDLFGAESSRGGGPSVEPPFQSVTEIFEQIFPRKKKSGPDPGVDIEHRVRVTLAEAMRGAEKLVDVELMRPCAECKGAGYPADKPPEPCPDCKGTGQRTTSVFPLPRACARCEGTGKLRRYTCRACAGEGVRETLDRLKVTIPAGVDTGTKLRMKGRGQAGRNGGTSGDLYVVVELAADERFDRDGADLRTEVFVGLKDALLGATIDVPLPDGAARMNLPAGTQGGQQFRLKGKGFPRMSQGTPGDLFVTVQLRVPKNLDDEARALVAQLAARVPDL